VVLTKTAAVPVRIGDFDDPGGLRPASLEFFFLLMRNSAKYSGPIFLGEDHRALIVAGIVGPLFHGDPGKIPVLAVFAFKPAFGLGLGRAPELDGEILARGSFRSCAGMRPSGRMARVAVERDSGASATVTERTASAVAPFRRAEAVI